MVDELLPAVVKAVDSAMKRDAASLDSHDVIIINQKGIKELTETNRKNNTQPRVDIYY